MKKPEHTGLMAFYDILGYRNFLENNTTIEQAINVMKLIDEVPRVIKESIIKLGGTDPYFHQKVESHVFSDTILIFIPYRDQEDEESEGLLFLNFFAYAALIFSKLFNDGLPVRGCITEGVFFSQNNCIAGKAVVEAHKTAESLDLSGLVVSGPAVRFAKEESSGFILKYLTQIKDSPEEKMFQVNWIYLSEFFEVSKPIGDVDSFVFRKFSAHGKDCGLRVDSKIRNTQKLIRMLCLAMEEDRNKRAKLPSQ